MYFKNPHALSMENIGNNSESMVYPKESIRVRLGHHRLAPDRSALHQREPCCSCIWNNYHRVGAACIQSKGVFCTRYSTHVLCQNLDPDCAICVKSRIERESRSEHPVGVRGSMRFMSKLPHDVHKLLKCVAESYVFPLVWSDQFPRFRVLLGWDQS